MGPKNQPLKPKKQGSAKTHPNDSSAQPKTHKVKYPRFAIVKALRIPRAILEQNAGKECTDKEAASYLGNKSTGGMFNIELNAAIMFGLIKRNEEKKIELTNLGRKILRPQGQRDELDGLREALLKAPCISEVYQHYRGENLPDAQFLKNALIETFKIPSDNVEEFKATFLESLRNASLIEERDGKSRIIDFSNEGHHLREDGERLKQLGKKVKIDTGDSCFVVMPFSKPFGDYYPTVYKPAIEKAGLKAIRADSEIFGSGKVMDQIWSGIKSARVLVAELTTKNANVFYELGLAHALKKPVVLVSSNEEDVPFDLHHIRVIYYDINDPFWGSKLIEKVAENIVSALSNPDEAIFEGKSN